MDVVAWLKELRRRRVIRALLAWGLFSFAVLQVVEPVQHALGLADWMLKLVVAVLAIGFPVTAGLAWAFDLTRKGVERTASPEGLAPTAAGSFGGARPAVALVLVGTVIGGGVAYLGLRHFRPATPVADADGRISVAVADFANQTGEPTLDALSGLLITSLEQSRKLKVLTRGRMLELLRQDGRTGVDRIDEASARAVGQKAAVRALLLASIQRLGPSYVVELRALDPQGDHYLFALREQSGDQAGILPLIDRLSEQVRVRLRESDADLQGADIKVADAVTPNLKAYRHYFKGMELRAELDDLGAYKEFQKAIELEPGFALAQLEISRIAWVWLLPGETLYREAARNASKLPDKEREVILTWSEKEDGRPTEAAARARRLAARYPDDSDSLMVAAAAVSEERDKVAFFRRVLALVPDQAQARVWASLIGVPLGMGSELLEEALVEERARPTAGAATAVGIARLGTGDAVAAVADFRRGLERKTFPWTMVGLTTALALSDDLDGLRKVAESGRLQDKVGMTALADIRLGRLRHAAQALGDFADLAESGAETWRGLEKIIRTAGGGRPAALVIAWAPERTRQAAALLDAGDLDGATRALGPVGDRECGVNAWLLGTIESERGNHAEAVTLLRRHEPCHTIGLDGLIRFVRLDDAQVRIARGLAATGRATDARPVLRRLLDRWKGADPDLPMYIQATALCREVGC
jgi:TolB-like protein